MPEKACGLDRNCAWRAETKLGLPPGSICIGLDEDGEPCGQKAIRHLGEIRDTWTGDLLRAGQPLCARHTTLIVRAISDEVLSSPEFDDVVDANITKRQAQDLEDKREARARKPDMVYFAKRGDQIKIGHSTIPKKRLRALANAAGAPFDSIVIAKGGWTREQEYHDAYAEDRVQGEWFTFTDPIAREMARLSNLKTSTTLEEWPKENGIRPGPPPNS